MNIEEALREADSEFLNILGRLNKTANHKSTLNSFLEGNYEIQYRFQIIHEGKFIGNLRELIGYCLGGITQRLPKVQVIFSTDLFDPVKEGRRLNLEGYFRIITDSELIESEKKADPNKSKTNIKYEHGIEAIQTLTKKIRKHFKI